LRVPHPSIVRTSAQCSKKPHPKKVKLPHCGKRGATTFRGGSACICHGESLRRGAADVRKKPRSSVWVASPRPASGLDDGLLCRGRPALESRARACPRAGGEGPRHGHRQGQSPWRCHPICQFLRSEAKHLAHEWDQRWLPCSAQILRCRSEPALRAAEGMTERTQSHHRSQSHIRKRRSASSRNTRPGAGKMRGGTFFARHRLHNRVAWSSSGVPRRSIVADVERFCSEAMSVHPRLPQRGGQLRPAKRP